MTAGDTPGAGEPTTAVMPTTSSIPPPPRLITTPPLAPPTGASAVAATAGPSRLDEPTQIRAGRAAATAHWAPEDRTEWAVTALHTHHPELSAATTWTREQLGALVIAALALVVGFVLDARVTGVIVIASTTVLYLSILVLRLWLLKWSLDPVQGFDSSDEQARATPEELLPRYTIIVPAYGEPEVIQYLIEALGRLDYPTDKLEILLALEQDDRATIDAAQAVLDPLTTRIVEIPPSQPRTKPKALNYALLESTGDLVTIFDAEDRPEALQLRRAALAMLHNDERLACVQARLDFYNPGQNLVTQWFTLDYAMWFSRFLPGLLRIQAPIPLGGTSNHFRRDALVEVCGWDPFNVTEDADLGIRLHRAGYDIGVINSDTMEEANSDVVNWVKQRSRWYKGYLQTWLVHMRHPADTWRDLGPRGFALFNLFVGGTPLLAVLNPLFWLMSLIWLAADPPFIQQLFPPFVLHASIGGWVAGNFLLVYATMLTAVERSGSRLMKAAVLTPVYYVLMSLAAYKALIQLVSAPSYWEKTVHGLHQPGAEA